MSAKDELDKLAEILGIEEALDDIEDLLPDDDALASGVEVDDEVDDDDLAEREAWHGMRGH